MTMFTHPNKFVTLANFVPSRSSLGIIGVAVSWAVYGLHVFLALIAALCFMASWWKQIQIGRHYSENLPYPYQTLVAAAVFGAIGVFIFAWLGFDLERLATAHLALSAVCYPAGHMYYFRKHKRF